MSGKPSTFCIKSEISCHMTKYLKGNYHRDYNSGYMEYAVEEPINDNIFGGKMVTFTFIKCHFLHLTH
jgi:hypothetical protein